MRRPRISLPDSSRISRSMRATKLVRRSSLPARSAKAVTPLKQQPPFFRWLLFSYAAQLTDRFVKKTGDPIKPKPSRTSSHAVLQSLCDSALAPQAEAVGDHGDEFGVGRLSLDIAHRIAEKALQRFQIAALPGDLNGVPDGALHTGGSGAEMLGDLRVQLRRDRVDQIHIPDRQPGSPLADTDAP